MKPLLSIIIPTKNRKNYCLKTINHILSLDLKEIQIVVQDNSDDDELKDVLSNYIFEKKITYNFTHESLNMSQNFQSSLPHILGEYFMFIGDDDSINPKIIEIVEFFKVKGAEAIVQNYPMYFVYPNNILKTNGVLSFYSSSGSYKKINIKEEVYNLVQNSFQEYTYTSIPRPYHGIIKTDVLNKINDSGASLFSGVSPDMYSAIILSQFIDCVYKIDYAFSIAGACPQSASSLGDNKGHCGKVEDAMHFKGREVVWSTRIPRFYSVQTIWALAAIEALVDLEKIGNLEGFDATKLTAKALVKNWTIKKLIIDEFIIFSEGNYLKLSKLFCFTLYEFYKLFSSKIRNRFKLYVSKEIKIIDKVETFEEALLYFERLNKSNLTLQ